MAGDPNVVHETTALDNVPKKWGLKTSKGKVRSVINTDKHGLGAERLPAKPANENCTNELLMAPEAVDQAYIVRREESVSSHFTHWSYE